MRITLWAVVALSSATLAAAQIPVPQPPSQPGPAPRSALRPQEVPVTIDGCVEGRRFTLAYKGTYQGVHEEVLRASEFHLEGSRELMRMLAREHDGHHEEITGIAILPPSPAGETVETRTKQVGGIRVFGGVRQTGRQGVPRDMRPSDASRPVRIRVLSVTHVADGCLSRS